VTFFRGNFSRTNSQYIMHGSDLIFVAFSTASHNSCKVASGWAFTAARMVASAAANLRDGPPAWASGAQLPVFSIPRYPALDAWLTDFIPSRGFQNVVFAVFDTRNHSFLQIC
jgi:hypothetical protein